MVFFFWEGVQAGCSGMDGVLGGQYERYQHTVPFSTLDTFSTSGFLVFLVPGRDIFVFTTQLGESTTAMARSQLQQG
jgi:hypothetical protein